MLIDLLTGMFIGLLIAVPVGPIDMICIHRSLAKGPVAGFIAGMGAAFADAIYGATAAFGLMSFTTFLLNYKIPFQILGGIFLCGLGIKNLISRGRTDLDTPVRIRMFSASLTTFFLALTSPMTILSFVGAFTALGLGYEGSSALTASMLTLGVFLGSTFWWLVLSYGVNFFKRKFNMENLYWINKFSGVIFLFSGIFAIFHALLHLYP